MKEQLVSAPVPVPEDEESVMVLVSTEKGSRFVERKELKTNANPPISVRRERINSLDWYDIDDLLDW